MSKLKLIEVSTKNATTWICCGRYVIGVVLKHNLLIDATEEVNLVANYIEFYSMSTYTPLHFSQTFPFFKK